MSAISPCWLCKQVLCIYTYGQMLVFSYSHCWLSWACRIHGWWTNSRCTWSLQPEVLSVRIYAVHARHHTMHTETQEAMWVFKDFQSLTKIPIWWNFELIFVTNLFYVAKQLNTTAITVIEIRNEFTFPPKHLLVQSLSASGKWLKFHLVTR